MSELRSGWRPSHTTVAAFLTGLALMFAMSLGAARWERFPGDLELARAVQDIDIPGLHALSEGAHLLAAQPLAVATVAVALVLFLALRRIAEAFTVAATAVPAALTAALKHLVDRPRPDADLLVAAHQSSSGSFPSGHVTYWVVVYGLLFVLVPVVLPAKPWRQAARGLLLAVIVFGGFSRVYVGNHWPSDILGGYLLGLLSLGVLLAAYRRLEERLRHQREDAG